MTNHVKNYCSQCLKTIRIAISHLDKSDGWAMASHVAMSIMMSLFPFLIFAVSLAGLFGAGGLSDQIVGLIFEYWPEAVAKPIINEIQEVITTSNKSFLTFGLILALFFASNGIEAIRIALNRAYADNEERSFIKKRSQSLFFVIIAAILILFLSILIVFLPIYVSFTKIEAFVNYTGIIQHEAFKWLTASGLLVFAIFACHRWLPGHRRPIAQIWRGVTITLVLWIIVATGFSYYLETFANYTATYAGLAGIMTALIFLYLMAVIFIFGAEINSAYENLKRLNN